MKRTVRFALLVLALSGFVALLAGCSIIRGPGARALPATGGLFLPTDSVNSTGKVAPDFAGVDVMTGSTVTLAGFEGKAVVLNFVNYGCNPSLDRLVSAQLLALRQTYRERSDFVPFSVFCGCCPPEVLRQFAANNGLDWPWVLDIDGSIVARYSEFMGEFGYPTLVFIDEDRVVVDVTGALSQADVGAALDRMSAGAVPEVSPSRQIDTVGAAAGGSAW